MLSMHFPQGIVGWSVLAIGLLIVMFRIRGVDAPRQWIEWLESKFTYATNMRFYGAILIIVSAALFYLRAPAGAVLEYLFYAGLLLCVVIGLGLLLFQNHLRHLVFATAESSDKRLRLSSIFIVVCGTALMLAPFFV